MGNLFTVYNLEAAINTAATSSPETFSPLLDGFDNVAEALNEVVQQYFFLSGKGFAQNHVTGMAPAWTLTGRRVVGDAAQDFIFSKKYKLDKDRQTTFQLKYTNGEGKAVTLTCPCTLCNIQEWSGASTDDSAISVEIRFDGAPTESTEE